MQSLSAAADISHRDFVVVDLMETGRKYSCNELSGAMGLSVSRGSRVVDRLVHKGYVKRRANPVDRRAVEVFLSRKGIRLKENIRKLKMECEQRILGSINTSDIPTVRKGMETLRQSLRRER